MKKILIVAKNCPACEDAKKQAGDRLKEFKIVEAETSEGMSLLRKLKVDGVPECVIVDQEKNKARLCTSKEWNNLIGKK